MTDDPELAAWRQWVLTLRPGDRVTYNRDGQLLTGTMTAVVEGVDDEDEEPLVCVTGYGWLGAGYFEMTEPAVRALPDLPSGVYRHYKGPLYFVFGYGHDANADTLGVPEGFYGVAKPLGERTVVVYMGLELTDAHKGPRIAVRTAEDFHALVHSGDGSVCDGHDGDSCKGGVAKRFSYVGPTWEGSG